MFGHIPDPLARTKRLLKIAQNELLDAEKSAEEWNASVKVLRGRVARLAAACQPAPTKILDGVTVSNITQSLVEPPAAESIKQQVLAINRNRTRNSLI